MMKEISLLQLRWSRLFLIVGLLAFILCSIVTSSFAGNYLWVANYGSDDVSKVDTTNNSVVSTIAVGDGPYAVAVSATKVFVAHLYSRSITVIDKFTDEVITTISLGSYPKALALGADNYLHVVGTVKNNSISRTYLHKVDIERCSKVRSLYLGYNGSEIGIGINKKNIAYITFGYYDNSSSYSGISIVDLNSYTRTNNYSHYSRWYGYLGAGVAIDGDGNGWVTGRYYWGDETSRKKAAIIKITPSGSYILHQANGVVSSNELVVDEAGFIWSSGDEYTLVRINPANWEINTFTLPRCSRQSIAQGLSYSDGHLWLVDRNQGVVIKIDPGTVTEVARVKVGDYPYSIGDLSGYEAGPMSGYTSTGYFAAPGTIFTKRVDQQFGNLLIDDGGRGSVEETTTIGAVGQHTIADIALLEGTNDCYMISVAQDVVTGWLEPGDRPDQTGLKGLWVSLDGNPDSTLYEILDNTSHSIIVKSSDDLSSYVGNILMGVIRLNSLTLSENGNLVTADVLYADTYNLPNLEKIADIPNILFLDQVVAGHLEIDSKIYNSLQTDSLTVTDGDVFIFNDLNVVNGNMQITGNGHLHVGGTLTVRGNLIVDGSQQLSADSIIVEGDLVLTAANLELNIANKVSVAGNVLLSSGSVVTVPAADKSTNTIYSLAMAIQGTLTIDDTSAMDLTGKGYPAGYTIGFGDITEKVGGSYGGSGGGASYYDTTSAYGDFRQVSFAGGGGYGSAGGGLLELDAGAIDLQGNGAILANGEPDDDQSGAGGGLDITTGNLVGTGRIQAKGGATATYSAYSGSGGRISIAFQDMSLPESQVSARGGERVNGNSSTYYVGGAGTVYLEKTGEAGRLIVDNDTPGGRTNGTPLRSVGFQQIVNWQIQAEDRLYIEVDGTPWTPSAESPDGIGLGGLYVDIQADTFTGPRYRVVDNGSNWLTLDTSGLPAGQSVEIGEALIGVINLQSLKIANGAELKTTDRLVLADESALEITAATSIYLGQFENWYNYTWPQGIKLGFNGDQTVQSLNFVGGDLYIEGSLAANGSLILSNSYFHVDGDMVTTGDMTLTDNSVVFVSDGDVQVTGSISSTNSLIYMIEGSITTGNDMSVSGGSVDLEQGGVTINGGLSLTDNVVYLHDVVSVNGDAGMTMTGSKFSTTNAINVTADVTLRENSEGVGSTITVPDAYSYYELIYSLDMDIGGTLTISSSSSLDMTGKGYPFGTTVGFVSTYSGGSHGGMSGGFSSDIHTYGDFRKARFAGGGGFIRLKAGNIYLEDNGAINANGSSADCGSGGGIHIETGGLTGTGFIQANGGRVTSTSYRTVSRSGGRISIYYLDMSLPENNISASGGDRATTSSYEELIRNGGAGTIFLQRTGDAGRLIVDNKESGRTERLTPLRSVGKQKIESTQMLDADTMQINVEGSPWQTPSASLDKLGLIGLQVDLSADDYEGPYYEIVDNGTNWITIKGESLEQLDLSEASLIGVVVLDSLEIRNGAAFSTKDRLVLNNPFGLDEYSMIEFGQFEGWENYNFPQGSKLRIYGDTVVESLTLAGIEVDIDGVLEVNGSLALQGIGSSDASLSVDSIRVAGNMIVEKAQLDCPDVSVGDGSPENGSIYLMDGTTWTVPDATSTVVYPLSITATGKLTVSDNAVINLDGKGYLERCTPPDGSYQRYNWELMASHGGLSSYVSATGSYGLYEKAKFPGSGNYRSKGGGFALITVGSLYISSGGMITANGTNYTDSYGGGGAGGGFHFEISDQFEGSGTISARGANAYYSNSSGAYQSGGGGRISIDIAPVGDKFVGVLDAGGGSYNNSATSKVAGAGTIYFGGEEFQYDDQVHLTVDNAGRMAASGSTPIRTVGRYSVSNAEPSGANAWIVYTETSHWKQYDQDLLGWGIVGEYIDLDPATTEGPYFRIIDNGTDNFTIEDPDGVISGVNDLIGQEFIGVHRFHTLNVTGGASVDFGADRVIVTDTASSQWDSTSEITADNQSVLPVQQ